MQQGKPNQNASDAAGHSPASTQQQGWLLDFGSEELPTGISVNPWDRVGPAGAPPPSELVAGEGAPDSGGSED